MPRTSVADIRNVAFCGHGSAGKTTLLDRILIKTGAANGHPSVDEGTSLCDFDAEEKHHKYTVEAKVVHFPHAGKRFHAIDTPGYPDFIGQTIGALRGVDTAAIVINAQSGIEVNTRRVFEEAGKAGVGRILIINKMDGENIDLPGVGQHDPGLVGTRLRSATRPEGPWRGFSGRREHAANRTPIRRVHCWCPRKFVSR